MFPTLQTRLAWGVLAVVLVGASCADRPAEPTDVTTDQALTKKIDEYIAPFVADHDISGVVLIGSGTETLYLRAFGATDAEAGTANAPTTRFAIASLTKTFTSGAVLIARDRGLLTLDDPLERFGLDFPRAADITVRQLLLHSSGLANPDYSDSLESRIEMESLIADIVSQPLLFEPGSQHRYSNAGYNMLAWVLQQASGTTYEEFLAEHVFGPLGMQATGHPTPDATEIAVGHVPAPAPLWSQRTPTSDASFSRGSGSLYSSAPDLLIWARAVGEERLFRWRELEWPYGWGRVATGAHEGVEQTGGTSGFVSNLLVYPDDGLFIAIVLNQEFGGWVPFGQALAAIAFDEPYEPHHSLQPVELSTTDRALCVGRYNSDDGFIDIEEREGHLWLFIEGWPVGKYLTPLGSSEFAIRADVGRIHFEAATEAGYSRMRWDSGEAGRTYNRKL